MRKHDLYTSADFSNMSGEEQEESKLATMVLDGGLSVCKLCGEFEAGLDKPCTDAETSNNGQTPEKYIWITRNAQFKTPVKAHGKVLSKWSYRDYIHLKFVLDLDSTELHTKDYGDVYDILPFIEDCENSNFIDYDGHASELLLDGKVVMRHTLYPTDVEFYKIRLKELNKQHGNKLKITWYNR